MSSVEKAAVLSDCGTYRYVLTREWDAGRPAVAVCMLNPSTADATADDPTIRRCVGFARGWGYGRLVVVNLFALRATDPAALRLAADPVGPDNDGHLVEQCSGRVVVCAWGATAGKWPSPRIRERPAVVRRLLAGADLRHLGLTGGGHPKHPLYLPAGATLQQFTGGAS